MSYIVYKFPRKSKNWNVGYNTIKEEKTTCRPEFMGPCLSRIFSEEKFQTDKV